MKYFIFLPLTTLVTCQVFKLNQGGVGGGHAGSGVGNPVSESVNDRFNAEKPPRAMGIPVAVSKGSMSAASVPSPPSPPSATPSPPTPTPSPPTAMPPGNVPPPTGDGVWSVKMEMGAAAVAENGNTGMPSPPPAESVNGVSNAKGSDMPAPPVSNSANLLPPPPASPGTPKGASLSLNSVNGSNHTGLNHSNASTNATEKKNVTQEDAPPPRPVRFRPSSGSASEEYFLPSSGIFNLNSDALTKKDQEDEATKLNASASQPLPFGTWLGISFAAAVCLAVAAAIFVKAYRHVQMRKHGAHGMDGLWGARERGVLSGEEEREVLARSLVVNGMFGKNAEEKQGVYAPLLGAERHGAGVEVPVGKTPLVGVRPAVSEKRPAAASIMSSDDDIAESVSSISIAGTSTISLPLLFGTGRDNEDVDLVTAVLGVTETSSSASSHPFSTSYEVTKKDSIASLKESGGGYPVPTIPPPKPPMMANKNESRTSLTTTSDVSSIATRPSPPKMTSNSRIESVGSGASGYRRRRKVKKRVSPRPTTTTPMGGGVGQGVPLLEGMDEMSDVELGNLVRASRSMSARLSGMISSDDNIVN